MLAKCKSGDIHNAKKYIQKFERKHTVESSRIIGVTQELRRIASYEMVYETVRCFYVCSQKLQKFSFDTVMHATMDAIGDYTVR